jgi:NAD(P)-dependent dehydrogenase (short-subunit alcohol dehydrogenase family)
MQTFEGRVAVVTGAASGIGFGLAWAFAGEGMRVVLADIDAERLDAAVAALTATGATVLGRRTDVTKPDQIQALADAAYAHFGAVHVLCNNAGVSTGGRTWEIDDDDWRFSFDVNFWAVVRAIRAFVPRMLARGESGHVVNTASMAGLIAGNFGMAPYAASKHAVVALSESLYKDLKLAGAAVSASVLCPGYVTTNLGETSRRNRPAEYGGGRAAPGAAAPGRGAASGPRQAAAGSFDPSEVAAAVVTAIKEDRFYVLKAQPVFFDWIRMRQERLLAGQNPAMPRRSTAG